MADTKIIWHKIAEHSNELDFGDNHIAVTSWNSKKICIGRFKEQLFAFAFTCPHAGGKLAEGFIDALGNVVCPLHRYKFSMENGRNCSGEGYYLQHWQIEQREEGLFIGEEEKKGWNFFGKN